jgi:hypothetical protein
MPRHSQLSADIIVHIFDVWEFGCEVANGLDKFSMQQYIVSELFELDNLEFWLIKPYRQDDRS